MSDDTPKGFNDEQARAILARAIEIDARAPMTTTEDLRVIAAEIGISSASLEAAVREHTTALTTHRRAVARRVANVIAWSGVPLGVGAGVLLSAGGLTQLGVLSALGVMAVGLVGSGGLVIYESVAGSLRSFHLKNLALWSGIFAGSVVSMLLLPTHVGAGVAAGWCLRSLVASSILGSAALIAVRRAQRPEGPGSDAGPGSTETKRGGLWARLARRIRDVFVRPLRLDAGSVQVGERRSIVG